MLFSQYFGRVAGANPGISAKMRSPAYTSSSIAPKLSPRNVRPLVLVGQSARFERGRPADRDSLNRNCGPRDGRQRHAIPGNGNRIVQPIEEWKEPRRGRQRNSRARGSG